MRARVAGGALLFALLVALAGWRWRRGEVSTFAAAPAAQTLSFASPLGDARVHVTPRVPLGASVPLVIVLHGLNGTERANLWFGEPADLAALLDRMVEDERVTPLLFAAPSQTRDAEHARTLWVGMDAAAFADSVDATLGGRAHVDRARIVLVGHSGAGCNPEGGVMTALRAPTPGLPRAVLAIDTCMDDEALGGYLAGRPDVTLRVAYERASWPRPFQRFCRGLAAADAGPADRACIRYDATDGAPHDDIVPAALAELLPFALPASGDARPLPSRPPAPDEADPVLPPDADSDADAAANLETPESGPAQEEREEEEEEQGGD